MNDITMPFAFLTKHNIVLSTDEISFAIDYDIIYLQDLSRIVDSSLLKCPDNENLLALALNFLLNESYINANVKNSNLGLHINIEEQNVVTNKWGYIILL